MRVALAQKHNFHTEIVGAFGALCEQLNIPYCIYYDAGDPMDMVPYITPNCIHYPISELLMNDNTWDVLILITSDEWILDHELVFLDKHKRRIISVHHSPDYLYKHNVSPYFFFLSPCISQSTYICPIYEFPNTDHLEVDNKVGMIGSAMEHTPGNKRDFPDIRRFLEDGKHLYHYCRVPYDAISLLSSYPDTYHGIYGLPIEPFLQEMYTLSYVWFPVPPDSTYATKMFNSAIGLALNMGKIMIMPEHLQKRYDIDGVITYKTSILEIDFTNIDKILLKQQMAAFCKYRMCYNHYNFITTLERVTKTCFAPNHLQDALKY